MLILHSPVDMHVHLRQGPMLSLVAPYTARDFAAAVAMPNLTTPVTDAEQVLSYRESILAAVAGHVFEPLMTLFSDRFLVRNCRPSSRTFWGSSSTLPG